MPDYFGKHCKFLCGIWENLSCPDHKNWEPVLNYCNHPDSKDDKEGSCNKHNCPLIGRNTCH